MLLAILPVLACGCHGSYLISQAAGEVRLLAAARPVEEVRSDPSQPSGRIENLRELAGLLAFAGDVGLDVGDSYRTVADHEGPVTWVVVAVKPGEIELFRWHFPLVGSVPYKGWFREEGAEMEAQEMRRRGFDVAVLPVPAFSTLGWFSDPLMPIQLDAPAGEFAEVVLHELVHRSCYFPGDARLSESVATFLGERLSRLWLATRFGDKGTQLLDLEARLRDRGKLRSFLALARSELKAAHREGTLDETGETARGVIEALRIRLRETSFELVDGDRLADSGWSVPRVLLGHLYGADEELLDRLWGAQGSDPAAFLGMVKAAIGRLDPRAALLVGTTVDFGNDGGLGGVEASEGSPYPGKFPVIR